VNIEERLEALTHTVELLAGTQGETEKRMAVLAGRVDQLAEKMATLADGMTLLTRVALDHAERIENLEGNQPRQ
jgi:hypothetical protein